jgi:hypothetical protein
VSDLAGARHHRRLITGRAASGGALTARELGLMGIWLLSLIVPRLPYGDAGQWP